jgi:hypothetical protein
MVETEKTGPGIKRKRVNRNRTVLINRNRTYQDYLQEPFSRNKREIRPSATGHGRNTS